MPVRDIHAALRQPEYTGENRCPPCTAVNVAIAAAASGVVAAVSVPAAATAFVASLAVIYLRGYLVPGTPALTKRYLPDPVLALFDHHETVARPDPGSTRPDPDLEDGPEALLRAAGAVREARGDLVLDDGFRSAWRAEMDRLAPEGVAEAAFAESLGVDEERLVPISHGNALVVNLNGELLGKWASRAAFVADVAAQSVLADALSGFDELPVDRRSDLVHGLRPFLEQCPDCGGAIELGEETVESCCRSREVIASSCRDCGARLLEIDVDAVEAADA